MPTLKSMLSSKMRARQNRALKRSKTRKRIVETLESRLLFSNLPLLYQSDLDYLGAFRVPQGQIGSSTFAYGGTAPGYNPANDSLFLVGSDQSQAIAEISIPEIVNSTNINDLKTASVIQGFVDVQSRVPNFSGHDYIDKIGGLEVVNGELIGTFYEYYDANYSANTSHFELSTLNLQTADVGGLYQVGNSGGGFVGGYMTAIPPEWQEELGSTYLTGQAGIPIVSRTSAGPAAFGFNPDNLGASSTPATNFLSYPLDTPLRPVTSTNPVYNNNSEVTGVVFPPNSSSVIFFGSHGTGQYCYGEDFECNDPVRPYKGNHSVGGLYEYQAWAYDANDFVDVRNGLKQPWELEPYDVWTFDLPFPESQKHIGGVTFDAQTGRIYVAQQRADQVGFDPYPLVNVFQLPLAPATGNLPPDIRDQAFSINENSPNNSNVGTVVASDPEGSPVTYSILSGNTKQAFVIDANTGALRVSNSAALDFETISSFDLSVQVVDNLGLSSRANIRVNINDINEAPGIAGQTFSVAKGSPVNTVVGTVTATDPEGAALTFSILNGNTNNAFKIDVNTGVIRVNSTSGLDAQSLGRFDISVRATDPLGLNRSATMRINVQNNSGPIISGVTTRDVTASTATVVWNTDVSADSQVEYGLTSSFGSRSQLDTALLTSHSIALVGLQPETEYFYRVLSRNANGVLTTSSTSRFTTGSSVLDPFYSYSNPKPLPPSDPTSTVTVSTVNQLVNAVRNLQSGQTIAIAPGVYNLTGVTDALYLPQGITNWAIRGATGNRDDVTILGNGMNGSVRFGFWVANSTNGTFADMTIDGISEHGIIANAGAHDILYHGLRIVDSGDQFIKSNPSGNGQGNDRGIVEYSIFEYRTTGVDDYSNGVDVHGGDDWIIQYNLFKNLTSPPGQGLAGPAILMWNGSTNTVADGNTFINVARGISFGLIDRAGGFDHQGGLISNNMFYRDSSLSSSIDVPIFVADSPATRIYHNTVLDQAGYPNAIEYRFTSTTNVDIRNNLVNGSIVSRNGGAASVVGNRNNATPAMFVNASVGDLHLAKTATAVINQGAPLNGITTDLDGQKRDNLPDIGADELNTSAPPPPENLPPVIKDQSFSINENSPNNSVVGQVAASDPEGAALSFSILAGNAGNAFAINPNTGMIDVASSTMLNFEIQNRFVLTIEAVDPLGLSRSATITINVQDINESPLLNNQTFEAPSSVPVGYLLGNILGSDPDRGAELTYSIISGNTGNTFSVNPTTGAITVNTPWNPTTTSLSFTVQVRDQGGLTDTANVTVLIDADTGSYFPLNEGSGRRTYDQDGRRGSLNRPRWSTGVTGTGLQFDGVNDWVTVNDDNEFDFENSFTMSSWVRPSSDGSWQAAIVKERPGGAAYGLYSSNDEGRPAVYISFGGDYISASGNQPLPLNTWSHLAGTYDGSVLRLYINGEQVSQLAVSGTIVTSDSPLRFGGNSVWGHFLNGRLDDVRLSKSVMSPAGIAGLAGGGSGSLGSFLEGEAPSLSASAGTELKINTASETALEPLFLQVDVGVFSSPIENTLEVLESSTISATDLALADQSSTKAVSVAPEEPVGSSTRRAFKFQTERSSSDFSFNAESLADRFAMYQTAVDDVLSEGFDLNLF